MSVDVYEKAKAKLEDGIRGKIVQDQPLTDKQVLYVQQNILPQYEVDCNLCAFNLANYLGVLGLLRAKG